jgi:hypothetical protein
MTYTIFIQQAVGMEDLLKDEKKTTKKLKKYARCKEPTANWSFEYAEYRNKHGYEAARDKYCNLKGSGYCLIHSLFAQSKYTGLKKHRKIVRKTLKEKYDITIDENHQNNYQDSLSEQFKDYGENLSDDLKNEWCNIL